MDFKEQHNKLYKEGKFLNFLRLPTTIAVFISLVLLTIYWNDDISKLNAIIFAILTLFSKVWLEARLHTLDFKAYTFLQSALLFNLVGKIDYVNVFIDENGIVHGDLTTENGVLTFPLQEENEQQNE